MRRVVGLGRLKMGMGHIRIQIPFPALKLMTEVDLLVVQKDILALLSVNDMVETAYTLAWSTAMDAIMVRRNHYFFENSFDTSMEA